MGGGSLRDDVARRAMAAGASKAYVVDGRDRFLRRFVFPSLWRTRCIRIAYPLATALARPLIAQLLVEVAERERATAVAHRLHRQGQRPGALRRRGPGARPEARGHRADARGHRPVAGPGDRICP
ncbi:MAG: argininosuccinate synthase [Chloroflexota bacterium]